MQRKDPGSLAKRKNSEAQQQAAIQKEPSTTNVKTPKKSKARLENASNSALKRNTKSTAKIKHTQKLRGQCQLSDPSEAVQIDGFVDERVLDSYAELGSSMIKLMQDAFQLHSQLRCADLEGAERAAASSHSKVAPSELLASSAAHGEKGSMLLYERVMAIQQDATRRYLHAMATVGGGSSGGDGASRSGLAAADALLGPHGAAAASGRPSPGGSHAQLDEKEAFRSLYMEILTEGTAEELDEMRRNEAMDEAGLSMLIDALQFGGESFNETERRLAISSFGGAHSWWEARKRGASHGDERAGSTSAPTASAMRAWSGRAGDGEDEMGADGERPKEQPLVAKALALVRELQVAS